MKKLFVGIIALGVGSTTSCADTLLADSVADFSDVQGENGWYYGYYVGNGPFEPSEFQLMTGFHHGPAVGDLPADSWYADWGVGGVWTTITAETVHPNGLVTSGYRMPIDHHVARRWSSSFDGSVTFEGEVTDLATRFGTGVIGRIFIDGDEIWSSVLDSGGSMTYSVSATVRPGSLVDFVVDPRDHEDYQDMTRFTAAIRGIEARAAAIPLPSAVLLMAPFGALLGMQRLRFAC